MSIQLIHFTYLETLDRINFLLSSRLLPACSYCMETFHLNVDVAYVGVEMDDVVAVGFGYVVARKMKL